MLFGSSFVAEAVRIVSIGNDENGSRVAEVPFIWQGGAKQLHSMPMIKDRTSPSESLGRYGWLWIVRYHMWETICLNVSGMRLPE